MSPEDLLRFLPPLPSASELRAQNKGKEALISAEPIVLSEQEFKNVLSGTVDLNFSSLTLPDNAYKVEVQAPSSGNFTTREGLTSTQLETYEQAAALRYTYRLDRLTPLTSQGYNQPIAAYEGLSSPQRDSIFRHLTGLSDVVSDEKGCSRWMLRDAPRETALESLFKRGQIKLGIHQAQIDAQAEMHQEAQDEIGARVPPVAAGNDQSAAGLVERRLWEYLLGTAPPLETQDRHNLEITRRVGGWLKSLRPALSVPSPAEVAQQLARETLLQPFRHLTGEWKDGRFVSYFTGREFEIGRLYDYLGVVPPTSMLNRVQRVVASLAGTAWDVVTGNSGHRPLLIHGLGGVGKSTLLAQFLLDHLSRETRDRFPYAYLDFDLSALNAREPLTLLAEAANQLAAQYPTSSEKWEAARNAWLDRVRLSKSQVDESYRQHALELFTTLLLDSGVDGVKASAQFQRGLPFLLVLDTVEEIQYSDRDGMKDIFRLLNVLRRRFPTLRVVLMGRAPLKDLSLEFHALEGVGIEGDSFGTGEATDFSVFEVPLGDLLPEQAQSYLLKQGVANPAFAEDLVNAVGGNPLVLRLIARVVGDGTFDLKSLREGANWRRGFGDWVRGRTIPPKAVLQGVLFKRILGHIHDEQTRNVAHPGLVLRRITPDLIRNVLAGPCGLGELSESQSKEYFQRLAREVALVGRDPDAMEEEVIRHRPELRQMMLRLMAADEEKQEQIRQVHQNAIHYYEARSGRIAREEALYHRLMIGEPPRSEVFLDDIPTEEAIAAGYVPQPQPETNMVQVWYALSLAAEELPLVAVAYLDARRHSELMREADWENAEAPDWELMIFGKASRRARDRGHLSSALEGLRRDVSMMQSKGKKISNFSPLPVLEFALLQRVSNNPDTTTPLAFPNYNFSVHPRRYLEYNILAARSRAARDEYARCDRHLITAAAQLEHTALTEDLRPKNTRQLLRAAADCQSPNMPLCSVLVNTLSRPGSIAALQNYPALARYLIGVLCTRPEGSDQAVKMIPGGGLAALLVKDMAPRLIGTAGTLLDRWWQELPSSTAAKAIDEVVKTAEELSSAFRAGGGFTRMLRSQATRPPASTLVPMLMNLVLNSAEHLTQLSLTWMEASGRAAQDAFTEAKRAGEIIPGEASPEAPQKSTLKQAEA